jgi:hypothetical protein
VTTHADRATARHRRPGSLSIFRRYRQRHAASDHRNHDDLRRDYLRHREHDELGDQRRHARSYPCGFQKF